MAVPHPKGLLRVQPHFRDLPLRSHRPIWQLLGAPQGSTTGGHHRGASHGGSGTVPKFGPHGIGSKDTLCILLYLTCPEVGCDRRHLGRGIAHIGIGSEGITSYKHCIFYSFRVRVRVRVRTIFERRCGVRVRVRIRVQMFFCRVRSPYGFGVTG